MRKILLILLSFAFIGYALQVPPSHDQTSFPPLPPSPYGSYRTPLPPLRYFPRCLMSWTNPVGTRNGFPFSFTASLPESEQLKAVHIKSVALIDSIQLTFGGYKSSVYTQKKQYFEENSPTFGGIGRQLNSWRVPYGQYVSRVIIRYQHFINGIQFITNRGQMSPWFGGIRGLQKEIAVGNGKIVGIRGWGRHFIDRIAFRICHMS